MLRTEKPTVLTREVVIGVCPAAFFFAPLGVGVLLRAESFFSGTVLLRDCQAQYSAHYVRMTDHARQCVLPAESRPLAREVERGDDPAAFLLAPLAACIDLPMRMRQTAGTAQPRATSLIARLVRGGTMSACLWSLQYSGGSPSKLYIARLEHPQSSTQCTAARTTCRNYTSFCKLHGPCHTWSQRRCKSRVLLRIAFGAKRTCRADGGLAAQTPK